MIDRIALLILLADFYVVREEGVLQDGLLYGADGHCAPENLSDPMPRSIRWLKGTMDYGG
jgi:hypothetical protein